MLRPYSYLHKPFRGPASAFSTCLTEHERDLGKKKGRPMAGLRLEICLVASPFQAARLRRFSAKATNPSDTSANTPGSGTTEITLLICFEPPDAMLR